MMAKFRLLSPHYINDAVREPGFVVDTDVPEFKDWAPSMSCEGVDADGKKAVEKYHRERVRLHPVDRIPIKYHQQGDYSQGTGERPPEIPYSISDPVMHGSVSPGSTFVKPAADEPNAPPKAAPPGKVQR